MMNKLNTVQTDSRKYLSFVLMLHRKRVTSLNIDDKECTLYDNSGNSFLNTYLNGFNDRKLKLRLLKDPGGWTLISNRAVLINGVAWRKKSLKYGDTIHLGEYRLVFGGSFIETPPLAPLPQLRGNRKSFIRILEAAALVLSVSFLWYCTTMTRSSDLDISKKETPSIDHESELPYDTTEDLDSLEYHPYKDEALSPLVIYSPGEDPAPQKLDILFIHTHPDDESLDYGLFLAEAAEEGEATGVILFTDGDSGFDKYPDRPIDGFYPDYELNVPNLAPIRVKEAEKALSVLGSEVYVRMGLWNRPYTAEEVNKSLKTLLAEWGGETFLVNKLVFLFERFQPDVIVSPDGPCKAREHFEHEAVGYLSEKAVDAYREKHPGKLKAYFKLVDVQQTGAYAGISLLDIDAGKNDRLKDLKRRALMMHQTQADASYFGIKRLEKYPVEYYQIQYNSENNNTIALAILENRIK